jgi:hypothetical protein
MMASPHTDPELIQWLRWASESGSTPMFVRTVAEAARMACSPDYVLLRPVLIELKRRYPEPPSRIAGGFRVQARRWVRRT